MDKSSKIAISEKPQATSLRRIALALLLVMLFAAGCSSSENSESGSGTDASTTVEATDDSQPSTTEQDSNSTGFTLPEGRLAEIESAGLTFEEIEYPQQPEGVEWPTEEWPTGDIPEGVDAGEVQDAIDTAFGELSSDDKSIDSIIVVQGGKLVVEAYNDWGPDEPHNSWSMAKSINSALIGILVGQGKLDINETVDAPEWSEPGDPRAEITLDQLLRMSSGLEWSESYSDPESDVVATLGGDSDRAHYTADKPLEHEPGSVWYYSSGTANLIARSVAEEVGYGDDLTGWIDDELFAKLGITTVRHNLDNTGLISGGSFIDMSPTDFARFGLLYARDGVWEGERILPEGWVDYSRMPTPNNPEGTYGAQWWLDPERPKVFNASGFNGQSIHVAPEQDLVIVTLSTAGDGRQSPIVQRLLDAFGA